MLSITKIGSSSLLQALRRQSTFSLLSRSRFPTMASLATVKSLDHLVLTVKDIDATIRFYEDVMGMKHTSFQSPASPHKRYALGKFSRQLMVITEGDGV